MEKTTYSVQGGVIHTLNGLPYTPRWFCDGRLAFQADNEGIADINFWGANSDHYIAFHKRFWGGIKLYRTDMTGKVLVRPQKCSIMPFGYKSVCDDFVYGIYAANNTIFITFSANTKCSLAMEFYDDYLFFPETRKQKDVRYGGREREWSEFVFENNRLCSSYTSGNQKTNVMISSNAVFSYLKRKKYGKHILSFNRIATGKEYVIAINFSNTQNEDCQNYKSVIEEQFSRYDRVSKRAPILKSNHEKLNQFFQLGPMYQESLKTTDLRGGVRAQSNHYWVWGWDSMTSNNCSFYWGDHDFIKDMLGFMEKNAIEGGIAHSFNTDMSISEIAPAPAQGMYLCIMDLCRLSGEDISKYYPFARKLFEIILTSEVNGTGLCRGTSLYPDFRKLIKESGNDFSTFNNTVCYCSARSMEKIAAFMGDNETQCKARDFADRMKTNFQKIMFNEHMGFIDSSVEAFTYEQRNVPSGNAVKWENNYCNELFTGIGRQCLDFYEKHLVCNAGLRPLPEWSDCYDADSNQLHCWWPVMSEFYTRLINHFDRPDLIQQYVGWVEYWSEKLTCPEGISCYCNEKAVPFDNWNSAPGIWHGYSIRGFYNSIVHAYIGLDFDERGLNFYPYSGEEVSIENLHFGKKTFDISMKGSGPYISHVVLNGKDLGSISTIPYALLQPNNVIEVTRKRNGSR